MEEKKEKDKIAMIKPRPPHVKLTAQLYAQKVNPGKICVVIFEFLDLILHT